MVESLRTSTRVSTRFAIFTIGRLPVSLLHDGDSTDDKILTHQDERYWILVTHDVVVVVNMILDDNNWKMRRGVSLISETYSVWRISPTNTPNTPWIKNRKFGVEKQNLIQNYWYINFVCVWSYLWGRHSKRPVAEFLRSSIALHTFPHKRHCLYTRWTSRNVSVSALIIDCFEWLISGWQIATYAQRTFDIMITKVLGLGNFDHFIIEVQLFVCKRNKDSKLPIGETLLFHWFSPHYVVPPIYFLRLFPEQPSFSTSHRWGIVRYLNLPIYHVIKWLFSSSNSTCSLFGTIGNGATRRRFL